MLGAQRGYYSYIYLKELGLRALAILSETVGQITPAVKKNYIANQYCLVKSVSHLPPPPPRPLS